MNCPCLQPQGSPHLRGKQLQAELTLYCRSGCMSTAMRRVYYQAACLLPCGMSTTRLHVYCNAACLLPGCMCTATRHVYYQASCLLPYLALLCPSNMVAESRLLTCQPRRSPHLCVILLLMCVLGIVVYDVHMVLVAVDAVVLLPHVLAASSLFVGTSTCLLLI